jgi:hypothetical protein
MVIKTYFAIIISIYSFSIFSKTIVLKNKRVSNGREVTLKLDDKYRDKYITVEVMNSNVLIQGRKKDRIKFKVLAHDSYINLKYFDNGWKNEKIKLITQTSNNVSMKSRIVDILVEIDKQTIAYGDGVLIKYSLLSQKQYLNYRISKFPSYEGFVKRFVDPGNSTRPIVDGGVRKFITPLYYVELFPLNNRKKIVYDMEIIFNENTPVEYKIVSVKPNLKFVEKPGKDFFKDVNVKYPPNFNLNEIVGKNKTFEIKIFGKGMLESLNDLVFKGSIIDKQNITLVDQKYRPGFAEKTFKVKLRFIKNKAGEVQLYFGGRVRKRFVVDSFTTVTISKSADEFNDKIIVNSPFYFSGIFYFLIILQVMFILFPVYIFRLFRLLTFLFRLRLRMIFPILDYEFFFKDLFKFSKYGPYFQNNVDRLANVPLSVQVTLKKINHLQKKYDTNNAVGIRISFLEIAKLVFFLNREGLWKF